MNEWSAEFPWDGLRSGRNAQVVTTNPVERGRLNKRGDLTTAPLPRRKVQVHGSRVAPARRRRRIQVPANP